MGLSIHSSHQSMELQNYGDFSSNTMTSKHQPHDCLLTVYSGADRRKHQSSPHKWPATWKMFPFDDVIIVLCHGGSPWWRHQMETFSALLAFSAGNSPVTGEFPAQRPVTRSFEFSLICAWIDNWANNGDAGDLRRHRANYDVIVMLCMISG